MNLLNVNKSQTKYKNDAQNVITALDLINDSKASFSFRNVVRYFYKKKGKEKFKFFISCNN